VTYKISAVEKIISFLKENSIEPTDINSTLIEFGTDIVSQRQKLISLLLRPQINIESLAKAFFPLGEFIQKIKSELREEIIRQAEITVKYENYVAKENEMVKKMNKLEDVFIKANFDYSIISSLSTEA